MANKIQIKRGVAASLPVLSDGELAFTTDSFRLYAGIGGVNKLIGEADFLKLGGGTLAGALVLAADPTIALHAATKQYVDGLIQGIKAKTSVRVASTGNLVLSAPQTIDGIACIAGNRVLAKDQTAPAENGVYTVAAGAWTRGVGCDTWAELISAFVWVEQGTANADSGWLCTIDAGGTLNTTAVTFVQFSGAGQITAGTGATKTGNTINVVSSGNGIVANADNIALTYGTGVNTVCQGNDARLSDARTPAAHVHGNISNVGAIGTTATLPIITTTSGVLTAGAFGTGAGTFCVGNDARLSDARTPVAHVHGNITNGGLVGVTANIPLITGTGGIVQAGSFGTGANTFCQGNDTRLHTRNADTGGADLFQIGGALGFKLQNVAGSLAVLDSFGSYTAVRMLTAYVKQAGANESGISGGANQGKDLTYTLPLVPTGTTATLMCDQSTVDGGTW